MNITHRTPLADQRARNITPVPVSLPDLPEGTQSWLAEKMVVDAKLMPRFNDYANAVESTRKIKSVRILEAMEGVETSKSIADKTGISPDKVRREMKRLHSEGFVEAGGSSRSRLWTKVEATQ